MAFANRGFNVKQWRKSRDEARRDARQRNHCGRTVTRCYYADGTQQINCACGLSTGRVNGTIVEKRWKELKLMDQISICGNQHFYRANAERVIFVRRISETQTFEITVTSQCVITAEQVNYDLDGNPLKSITLPLAPYEIDAYRTEAKKLAR